MRNAGRRSRRSRCIPMVILAIVLAGGLSSCKALPKPHVPSLGGSVMSSLQSR